jgi:hypothetical protein
MAAEESKRALIERVLARPVADATQAVWGFQNRTDIVTLGSGERVVVQRYRRRQDADYRLRVMRALWRPAAEAGIAIPRIREADLHTDPAWAILRHPEWCPGSRGRRGAREPALSSDRPVDGRAAGQLLPAADRGAGVGRPVGRSPPPRHARRPLGPAGNRAGRGGANHTGRASRSPAGAVHGPAGGARPRRLRAGERADRRHLAMLELLADETRLAAGVQRILTDRLRAMLRSPHPPRRQPQGQPAPAPVVQVVALRPAQRRADSRATNESVSGSVAWWRSCLACLVIARTSR